jgi:succinate dehydrogenase flavin-adding protein (antitoxin of CptAB toxin-antitoxin module)
VAQRYQRLSSLLAVTDRQLTRLTLPNGKQAEAVVACAFEVVQRANDYFGAGWRKGRPDAHLLRNSPIVTKAFDGLLESIHHLGEEPSEINVDDQTRLAMEQQLAVDPRVDAVLIAQQLQSGNVLRCDDMSLVPEMQLVAYFVEHALEALPKRLLASLSHGSSISKQRLLDYTKLLEPLDHDLPRLISTGAEGRLIQIAAALLRLQLHLPHYDKHVLYREVGVEPPNSSTTSGPT